MLRWVGEAKICLAKNKLVVQKLSVCQGDEMKQVLSEAKQEIVFKQIHLFSATEFVLDIILKQMSVREIIETLVKWAKAGSDFQRRSCNLQIFVADVTVA